MKCSQCQGKFALIYAHDDNPTWVSILLWIQLDALSSRNRLEIVSLNNYRFHSLSQSHRWEILLFCYLFSPKWKPSTSPVSRIIRKTKTKYFVPWGQQHPQPIYPECWNFILPAWNCDFIHVTFFVVWHRIILKILSFYFYLFICTKCYLLWFLYKLESAVQFGLSLCVSCLEGLLAPRWARGLCWK